MIFSIATFSAIQNQICLQGTNKGKLKVVANESINFYLPKRSIIEFFPPINATFNLTSYSSLNAMLKNPETIYGIIIGKDRLNFSLTFHNSQDITYSYTTNTEGCKYIEAFSNGTHAFHTFRNRSNCLWDLNPVSQDILFCDLKYTTFRSLDLYQSGLNFSEKKFNHMDSPFVLSLNKKEHQEEYVEFINIVPNVQISKSYSNFDERHHLITFTKEIRFITTPTFGIGKRSYYSFMKTFNLSKCVSFKHFRSHPLKSRPPKMNIPLQRNKSLDDEASFENVKNAFYNYIHHNRAVIIQIIILTVITIFIIIFGIFAICYCLKHIPKRDDVRGLLNRQNREEDIIMEPADISQLQDNQIIPPIDGELEQPA